MKTILTLTDFSRSSDNAARYALHLGRILKSDVRLIHALDPDLKAAAAEIVVQELDIVAKRLTLELELNKTHYAPSVYQPTLTHDVIPGDISNAIRTALVEQDIELVTMGLSDDTGAIGTLLRGHRYDLMQAANFPLLLIPPNATYQGIHRAAFAGQLIREKITCFRSFAQLMKPFNTDMTLVHVVSPKGEPDTDLDLATFLDELGLPQQERRKVSLETIAANNVAEGLLELTTRIPADLLAIVHLEHGFFERLWHAGHTQALSRKIKIPLLVLPSPDKALAFQPKSTQ